MEEQLRNRPEDPWLHGFLGQAYAGLRRKEDAIREGKRATELLPISKDAIMGPIFLTDLAAIYAKVGEHQEALDQIEYLLSIPSFLSIQSLQLESRWKPLWNHPRFQELVEKYG